MRFEIRNGGKFQRRDFEILERKPNSGDADGFATARGEAILLGLGFTKETCYTDERLSGRTKNRILEWRAFCCQRTFCCSTNRRIVWMSRRGRIIAFFLPREYATAFVIAVSHDRCCDHALPPHYQNRKKGKGKSPTEITRRFLSTRRTARTATAFENQQSYIKTEDYIHPQSRRTKKTKMAEVAPRFLYASRTGRSRFG